MEVGEGAREEGQGGEGIAAERVRVVEDDYGGGGGQRGGRKVRAEADAGRAAAAGVADGAAGRSGGGALVAGVGVVEVHLFHWVSCLLAVLFEGLVQ